MSRKATVLSAVTVALTCGGLAAGAISDSGGIKACYDKSDGALRVLLRGKCAKFERAVTLGRAGGRGPAGAPGATGPAGATGPQGSPGANGAAGATGDSGAKGDTGLKGDKGDKGDTGAQGPGGSEAWHDVTGLAGDPCYNEPGKFCSNLPDCQWGNLGGGNATAAYYRDPTGVVHLKGIVKRTGTALQCSYAATYVFWLPVGYRPGEGMAFPVISDDAPATIYIDAPSSPHGAVHLQASGNPEAWLALDGITFRCGPSGANGCP